MKNLTFCFTTFLTRPFFDTPHPKESLQKGWSQKRWYNKTSVFSCLSTMQRNFWNPFVSCVEVFSELFSRASNTRHYSRSNFFHLKIKLFSVFSMWNSNFMAAPESEGKGFALLDMVHSPKLQRESLCQAKIETIQKKAKRHFSISSSSIPQVHWLVSLKHYFPLSFSIIPSQIITCEWSRFVTG